MFLEVRAANTSVERSLGSTGGSKLRNVIFVVIESGMTLLVIQLIRLVLGLIEAPVQVLYASDFLDVINEMFNVIIRSVHFYFFCFTEIFLPG